MSSCGTQSGTGCAPDSQRVDLYVPTFSHPTTVTNPLNPISDLRSAVFTGHVDGLPFRTETTLLPSTRMIHWNGQEIETLQSQYMAFSDGRLQEIAVDSYAQDDDGAVWYFGETVSDYDEEGVAFTDEGTWQVGSAGAPLAMIMGSHPRVGDVWRAENIAPIAWEEVTVTSVDVRVDGPSGPVEGAIIGSELHMEGSREEKIFAPGYGEFSTGSLATDDLEALALAVPTDALAGSPAELSTLARETAHVFDAAQADDFDAASTALANVSSAWGGYAEGQVPPLLENEVVRLLALLVAAVDSRSAGATRHQAIALARVIYDLRLRHRPPAEIDEIRFDLWMAQVLVDAAAGDIGSIRGDAASARLVFDRFRDTLDSSTAADIENRLGQLSAAADGGSTAGAVAVAGEIRAAVSGYGWQ